MAVCTIDVHSRDVIAKMILQKIESSTAFQWQSQLRHRWDLKVKDCFGNICDAQFRYDYEYLGCTPRLVITPLTDRCYITLTQVILLYILEFFLFFCKIQSNFYKNFKNLVLTFNYGWCTGGTCRNWKN